MSGSTRAASASTVRVLLVEVDEEDYLLVRRWLADSPDSSFHLEWVSTPDEARTLLARAECDLCLLDYRLGPHSGLELLREAVAKGWNVPIVLLTGESAAEAGVAAIRAGAADYMVKGEITASSLVRSLRHVLERQRLLASAQVEMVERQQAEQELRTIISKARCLIWNAEVIAEGAGKLCWHRHVPDEAAAQRFLPLDTSEFSSYSEACYDSYLNTDRENPNAYCVAQVRLGNSYCQEFLCRDAHGLLHWIVEDVQVEAVAPGRWYAVGVCTDITELRDAEHRLRAGLAILRAVTEGAADTIFVKGLDGRYLMINTTGAQLLGRTVEEVIGADDRELRSPDTAQQILEHDRAVLATSQHISYEQTVTQRGVTRVYHVTQGPRYGADGAVEGVVGISRDITERKQAEEALRRSEESFRTLTEAVPQIVWITQPDGRNTYFSQRWVEYTGLSRKKGQGHGWVKPCHPDERRHSRDAWQHATATGAPYSLEIRLRRADGIYRWWMIQGVPVKDAAGNVLKWIGTCTDIDDLKRVEAERGELLEKLNLQVERMPLAYLLSGPDFRYTHWNPAAEAMFGFTNAEACGKHPFELIVPQHARAAVEDLFTELAAGDMNAHGTAENVNKAGRVLTCEWHNTPLFGPDGAFQGLLSLAQDVSQRRHLEEQLRQAQKMEAVGRLAGGVAHDFNNLLTVISGYSEMLLMKMTPADPQWTAVAEIRKAGERAAGLTRQLLAFSRQQVIKTVVLDLNEVVSQTEAMLRRLIGEDVLLTTHLDPDLLEVRADSGQIDQVVMNLCVNARDAMPTGGELTIETHSIVLEDGQTAYPALKPGSYAQLRVSDTGCGMTQEVKAQIFEPFFTTKGVGQGTGLGLATVFGIVKQSHGHVSVHSEVGAGTTFTVFFPAVSPVAPPTTQRHQPPSLRGTETVLLAEDDYAVRTFTRIALEAQGYTVLEADSGTDAIRKSDQRHGSIELMLADVVMPEMGGRRLAEELRLKRPEMKVLYMSGYTDVAARRYGIIDAADHFIQMPFAPLGLAKRVRAVLDGSD